MQGVFCMEMFTEELKTLTQSREVRAIIDNNNGQHKCAARRRRSLRSRPVAPQRSKCTCRFARGPSHAA